MHPITPWFFGFVILCIGFFLIVYALMKRFEKQLKESQEKLVSSLKGQILLLKIIRDFHLLRIKIKQKEKELL